MIWLAASALLISALTLWYVTRPLMRPVTSDDRERLDQLQQLRDRLLVQLDELDIEEGDRNIDAAVVVDERQRLEGELAKALRELETLRGAKKKSKAKPAPRQSWIVTLVVLCIVLPVAAAGLYAMNQRATLAYISNPEVPANASQPPMVMEMVARLEKRLEEQPDDAAGWFKLGRAYAVLGRQDAANSAYARAYKLTPDDPQVVAEYATFLYNGDPENTGGQVLDLFTRLLKLDPNNQDALWFLGFASFQHGDSKQALKYWEQLLKGLAPDSKEAEHIRLIITKTREKLRK